jgi:hypothetical protein
MRVLILILFIAFLLVNCIGGYPQHNTVYRIINESGHKIFIRTYRFGLEIDTFTLYNSQYKNLEQTSTSDYQGIPLYHRDSLIIVFDDSISVWHKIINTDTNRVKNNLLENSTYTKVSSTDLTVYSCTIKLEDYEYALH